MKVGIIGMGVIGQAQAAMFGEHVFATYDPARDEIYPYTQLEACEFAVLCVGTPAAPDGSADLTALHTAVSHLPPLLPVLVRSTCPPGTSGKLFQRLTCVAPEFMGENPGHPWQKPTDVPYMILGGNAVSRTFFIPRLTQVYSGVIHQCSAIEAEMTKYVANLYWATRVTFVNEMAGICQAFGVDYEEVKAAWLNDPRMTPDYTAMDGHPPGFGGRCWPKDLMALVAASAAAGHPADFLASVHAANRRFVNAA